MDTPKGHPLGTGVSTHWRDDYGLKLADYEAIGIEEY